MKILLVQIFFMAILYTFFTVLDGLDKLLFMLINHDSDSKYLDPVMIAIRNPLSWIPLYVVMLWYSVSRMGKNAIRFILLGIIVFAIADIACYRMLKPLFERPRPCNDPKLFGMVRVLVDCGGGYSFPSNHAANHFGLATFWFLYIRENLMKKWYWLWAWAAIICYAQIYVGKHFPSDIIAGALLGMLTGFFIFSFRQHIPLPFLSKDNSMYRNNNVNQ